MKVYEVLLLLGALVVTVARVTSEDAAPECRGDPETDRWRKDCNWCSCRNGRQACTRKTCPQGRQEEGPQCEGHPSWKDDCNDCVCAEGKVICTSAYCGTLSGSQPAAVSVERQLLVCDEGSRYRDGCNWCVCAGGMTTCTTSTCTDWNESTAVAEGVVQCHGTSRWKKDCNWCNCVNGRGVCTTRACIPPERDPFHNLPESATCVPGSRWKDECNWCACGEAGHAACTLKGCLPGFKDDGPTCEDGSVWKKDGCNICRCINGTSACSKRLCLSEEDPAFTSHQLPEEPQCQGDPETDRWRQDCNWCRCLNGVGACTRRLCREGRRDERPECEGNPSWKKDCNTCSCVNGTAVCTFKFCGPLPTRPSLRKEGPEPQCQGDSETDRWRQDCNWCRCRNGVGTCTRKLCHEGAGGEGPECEGNPSWKKDCNTCTCVNGIAICTTIFCGPFPDRPIVLTEVRKTDCQGDPETDRWTEDCNSCQCRNGLPACTKKLCRKDDENLPVCEGNPSWQKDCNRCHCNNGTVMCTTMFCGGPLATPSTLSAQFIRAKNRKQECEDGSEWRDDCNWCSCYEGRASCTKMGCMGQNSDNDEPECEGVATWKRDCNWCTCGDGLALCTRMACLKPAEEPCTEETSWRQDCNLCRCSHGFILCTTRACVNHGRELDCQEDSCGPSQLPDLCYLPPVSGHRQCTAFFQKWSFFENGGQCKQFVYGGCGGTANLFNTKEECEAACPTTHAASTTVPRQFLAAQSVSAGGERCTLPKVAGPCFAAFPRYAYNAMSGSCEPFIYGGCMGNANNFMTEEECITVCQGTPACDKSKCPWHLWEHYLTKECVPQYAGDACCPTSFSCQNASESGKDPTKCYYRGVTYNPRDTVPVEDLCSASCTCVEAREPNLTSVIDCANVECPELFRPPPPGCRLLYRADRCCPYDRECTEPGTPPLEFRSATCVWKNKTFHDGDKMYFDDVPCRFCICGPGFTDPYGPGCSKLDCGLEFRYTTEFSLGCTPIRFETNRCCPISWMCPDDPRIDPQQQQQQPGTVDELAVCHLGDRRLAVGEALGLMDCDIECRCLTPPELTCTKYRSCELAQETAAQRACPPLECDPGCRPLVSGPKQCPTCSCSFDTFSCPAQTCPSTCHSELDLKTGCPSCKCKCPSEVPCPTGCPVHTVLDEATGCPYCECKFGSPQVRSPNVSCPVYPDGWVPCPQDCAIIKRVDENGCEVCECDPNDTETPFGHHHPPPPPPPPSDPGVCPGEGQAPCPMDCGIIRRMDENGCEVCECDPDDTYSPFDHPLPTYPPTPCRTRPDGRAPCPMDCAIIRYKDENGCEVCKCDPDNPGTPFGPYRPHLLHEV